MKTINEQRQSIWKLEQKKTLKSEIEFYHPVLLLTQVSDLFFLLFLCIVCSVCVWLCEHFFKFPVQCVYYHIYTQFIASNLQWVIWLVLGSDEIYIFGTWNMFTQFNE